MLVDGLARRQCSVTWCVGGDDGPRGRGNYTARIAAVLQGNRRSE